MKRRVSFGASAITVLAAFSGVAGCEDADDDPTLDAGGDGGPGVDAGPMMCPAAKPRVDEACNFSSTCVYARCSFGNHPTEEAVCQGGKVAIRQTSCNPPFPDDAGPSTDASVDASTDAALATGMDGG